ncbi:MAG: hypothetical protein M3Q30_23740 [Actinomycetota bacterium]|nr:hypothetical protein [Actinomycetota bacterium]
MTRPTYLTARCTRGCETWAPPEEMERHVRDKRCNGRAWFRGVERTMLLDANWARMLRASGGEALLDFERMKAYRTRDARRPHLPLSVQFGAVLASPVERVTARVWWYVVKPRLLTGEDPHAVVACAMTDDGFTALAPADLADRLVTCGSCGDVVIGLSQHQRSSRRCRMASAANRVNELWHAGYRDPWTIRGSAPLTWSELRASRWRKHLAVVEFPKWNAVLVVSSDREDLVA